ncbi:CBS domain-containing protein [Streptomyces sp. NPDC023723]|uniref:CBS domain-containing protein n=1 Tax=Streptomyces sp. NPDC023723 TaxID=3154323 RepID=UPI0033E9088B
MHGSPHIVSDVMTRDVVTVHRTTSFKDIARLLALWKISAVPVLNGRARVVGVVSEADLLCTEEFRDRHPYPRACCPAAGAKAGARTAAELMTGPALTVDTGSTLARAAHLMTRHQVGRLPVVDDETRPVGLISRSDLLRVFLRKDDDIAEEVRREIVSYLFPTPRNSVRTDVRDGIVVLSGRVRDRSLVPAATRLARAVEGVIGVECRLTETDGRVRRL